MKQYRILYNPLAGNGTGKAAAMRLPDLLPDCELRFYDLTEIADIPSFLSQTDRRSAILVAGGDGTLSRFANETADLHLCREIYYYATGVTNDFWRDIGRRPGDPPVRVNRYLERLPTARTDCGTLRILNGMTCGAVLPSQIGCDRPTCVTVTVDGTPHRFDRVWLTAVTHGKFCNGLMPSPGQDRLCAERLLTVTVLHGPGRFGAAKLLRALRAGKCKRDPLRIDTLTGSRITVTPANAMRTLLDGEDRHTSVTQIRATGV